jgi:hyperosmotically inducible protein
MKLKVIFLAAAAALLFSTVATADRTAGETVDDSTTQAAVKAELMGDDFFGGMGINIETHKGVVQLGGWIDDAEAGANAAKLAAGVDGVKSVDNQLHVKQGKASMGQTVDDTVITTRTKAAHAESALCSSLSVNVDTYNGVVLLTGFADSDEAKKACGDATAAVANVKNVINGIYVPE